MMLRYVGSEDSELSEHFTNGKLYIADKSELFSFLLSMWMTTTARLGASSREMMTSRWRRDDR